MQPSTRLAVMGCLLLLPLAAVTHAEEFLLTFEFYGATLGEDWEDFPVYLVPNIAGTPGSNEKLEHTAPIYLVWQNLDDYTVGEIEGGPIPITEAYWWDEHWDEATIFVVHNDNFNDDYKDCSSDISASLNSSGELTVVDNHFGGIGSNTRIELRWCFPTLDDEECGHSVLVAVQWDRPATYYDADLATDVDATPGVVTVVEDEVCWRYPCHISSTYQTTLFIPQINVEWVSTDARGATDGTVDAGDIAALAAHLSETVEWGWDSQGGRDELNFHVNFNPFGTGATSIGQDDLSALAVDLEDQCGGSKAGEQSDASAMLAWFGAELTGETIAYNGLQIPEYAIVDWQKLNNAIADPYGYRQGLNAAATVKPWSQVKQLYR